MCLIAFAHQASLHHRLILAGNRDEFHVRPTAPLAHWTDTPQILAGRDLESGGTWMGVAENGRACVVTNVREPQREGDLHSRGLLTADYLRDTHSAHDAAVALIANAGGYRPFNLVLFDREQAHFITNRPQPQHIAVAAGIHGLSNATLNTPWPKTLRMMQVLQDWIAAATPNDFTALFAALADETRVRDAELPDTGLGPDIERRLSPAFIRGPAYGTRASSVIVIDHNDNGIFIERRFGPDGVFEGETTQRFSFRAALPSRD